MLNVMNFPLNDVLVTQEELETPLAVLLYFPLFVLNGMWKSFYFRKFFMFAFVHLLYFPFMQDKKNI